MYTLVFHKDVVRKDLKKMNKSFLKKLFKTLKDKLSKNPKEFGKPLKGDLKGYFRLRFLDLRVIYCVKEEEVVVYVLQVGNRRNSEVYLDAMKRLRG